MQMQRRLVQGFWTGGSVVPRNGIVVRRSQVDTLLEDHRHFAVIASRQSGKTTLLKAFQQEENERYPGSTLYVTCEPLNGLDSSDSLTAETRLVEEIRIAARSQGVVIGGESPYLISLLRETTDGVTFIFDEFSKVGVHIGRILSGVRGFVESQRYGGNHRFILADRTHPADHPTEHSPFNFVQTMRLFDMDELETAELATRGFEANGMVATPQAIDKIHELTRGHTYLVQTLGILIAESCFETEKKEVTVDDVVRFAYLLARINDDIHWKTLMLHIEHHLTGQQKAYLRNIIRYYKNADPVERYPEYVSGYDPISGEKYSSIDILQSYGFVRPSDERYMQGFALPRNPIMADMLVHRNFY